MKKINYLLPLVLALILGACSNTSIDPVAAFKNQSASQIFRAGEIALAEKDYAEAIRNFEAMQILYPFGLHTEQAQLDLIYAYYMNDDNVSASAAAERFIHLYPRSDHVDYAYYMRGLADFEQDRGWMQRYLPIDAALRDPGTARIAFADFAELLRLFPHSCYAADARQRMIYLKNLFAKHELRVAEFYYHRGAYVASAGRANYILQHYQESSIIPDALIILIRSYQNLHLVKPAADALDVLRTNFPEQPELCRLMRDQQQLYQCGV